MTTSEETWTLFEFMYSYDATWWYIYSPQRFHKTLRMELCSLINKIQAILFQIQLPFSNHSSNSFKFYSELIPVLRSVCSVLHCFQKSCKKDDPLQLRKIYLDTCNILDECCRQILSGPIIGPFSILMHIMLDFEFEFLPHAGPSWGPEPKSLLKICRTYNIPDLQLVKRFLLEHSFLFYIQHKKGEKVFPIYCGSCELRNFFFDPGRSQDLYPLSWITSKCQKAIEYALGLKKMYSFWTGILSEPFAYGLQNFFTPNEEYQISNAKHMLHMKSNRNMPDINNLLHFLRFLGKISWQDIFLCSTESQICSLAIAQWVSTAMSNQESSSLQCGNIQKALNNLFIKIIPCGILPVLCVNKFQPTKIGIFEDEYSGCLNCSVPQILAADLKMGHMSTEHYQLLFEVLYKCMGQDYFQQLCTTTVEAALFKAVYDIVGFYSFKKHSIPHICRHNTSHIVKVKKIPHIFNNYGRYYVERNSHHNWRFAFSHASKSSKSILFALQWLHQLSPFAQLEHVMSFDWIVSEMVEWLKTQTADPQPQDELITWMEGECCEVEQVIEKRNKVEDLVDSEEESEE